MAKYWVKQTSPQAQGPYPGEAIEAMLARGHLGPNSVVSVDQVNWVVASQAAGLIAASAKAAGPMAEVGAAPVQMPVTPISGFQAPAQAMPPPLPPGVGIPMQPRKRLPTAVWILIGIGIGLFAMALLTIPILLPSLARAREIAHRARCARNLQMIGQGIMTYASHNDGHFPLKIEDLVLSGDVRPENLVCEDSNDTVATGSTPAQIAAMITAGGHCTYIYCGAGLTNLSTDSQMPVAYEPLATHKNQGINVLMGDGKVQWASAHDAPQVIQYAQDLVARRKELMPP